MPTSFTYKEAGFNADSIASYATEADFIKSHTGQKTDKGELHQSTDLTVDELKEVYKLAKEAVKAHPKPAEKPVVKITHMDEAGNVLPAVEAPKAVEDKK